MSGYHHILLLTNEQKDPDHAVAADICARLASHDGVTVYVREEAVAEKLHCTYAGDVPPQTDLAVVIGGDGCILDASVIALERDIPLLGVNLGHLGYLAELDTDELSLLEGLYDGSATVIERMALSLSLCDPDGREVICERLAVNDITLTHQSNFGLADMLLTDDTGTRVRYRGDGLILATPAGSTAYSFSAGGPIIAPQLEALCITPICPHSFFNRSMILGADTDVRVTNTSHHGERLYVCMDGRTAYELISGEGIRVHASPRRLKMVTFGVHPAFNTLRRKMELAELKD